MRDNYLLTTETAQKLYWDLARDLPIIDYHNHLSVKDLAADRQFEDIAQLWLISDPYKHRAMRICGVPEELITGSAGNREKFKAWCGVYPQLMGGPLYDWSKMEMEQIFEIYTPICQENSELLWDKANEKLKSGEFSARSFLKRFKAEYVAPCTGISEDLSIFSGLEGVAPSLRGDDLMCPSPELVKTLAELTDTDISDFDSLFQAIGKRLDAFSAAGCCFSDHALDNGFRYVQEDGNREGRLRKRLAGEDLSQGEKEALASDMLRALAHEYAKRGWTMQLHIGAQRFTSTSLRRQVGAAGGFAAIGRCVDVSSLVSMLDDMELAGDLPRVILYTLNPGDNAVLSVLSGSFPGSGVRAKVSQGPAWWWCDHLQGMREMLDVFACFSVLSTFTGMTTDSRSLLSLLRHDYFRRTVCGWVGEKAQRGELPGDIQSLSGLIEAICYKNAKKMLKEGNKND